MKGDGLTEPSIVDQSLGALSSDCVAGDGL